MLCVQTASRLHFGFLSLPGAGEPARRFGGVGLMVERPGLRLSAAPAAEWSAEGPLAGRALTFACTFARGVAEGPPQRLVVEQAAPEHAGLGTGTQLGLAVARLLAAAWGLDLGAAELARRVGRGLRSALGVYGFEQGGFLVESGKRGDDGLSPLAARVAFPEAWRVVLALPRQAPGLHGPDELGAFRQLAESAAVVPTDALCRLVLLGMLPALAEGDLGAFGEALFDFNARVGEAFARVQGGPYAGPRVAELVAFVRGQGVRGVGQSSWGPAVFAAVGGDERAADLAGRVRRQFGLSGDEVFVTRACNHGAVVGPGLTT
jgi:beta-ribofuranosylaminobenzene 5'-phosphate synthase